MGLSPMGERVELTREEDRSLEKGEEFDPRAACKGKDCFDSTVEINPPPLSKETQILVLF